MVTNPMAPHTWQAGTSERDIVIFCGEIIPAPASTGPSGKPTPPDYVFNARHFNKRIIFKNFTGFEADNFRQGFAKIGKGILLVIPHESCLLKEVESLKNYDRRGGNQGFLNYEDKRSIYSPRPVIPRNAHHAS